MKKRFIILSSGLGILLVSFLLICGIKIRSDEREVWEQQSSREVQSLEESVSQAEPEYGQESDQMQESQTSSVPREAESQQPEEVVTTPLPPTYIPEEYNWAEEDISDRLFQLMPEEFWFASGAGAWSTVLHINDDGTFTGKYADSDTNTVYICEFTGSFTQPVKIDYYTYSMQIASIDYSQPKQEYDEGDIHYITSIPYGLENAEEVLIYIPGYPVSELPKEALSWLGGSASAFWYGVKPVVLPFFALYNVNDKEAFSSEPLWENNLQVQLREKRYYDERFFQGDSPASESDFVYYVVDIKNVNLYSFDFVVNRVVKKTGEVTEIIADDAAFSDDGKRGSCNRYQPEIKDYLRVEFLFGEDPLSLIESFMISGIEELENIRFISAEALEKESEIYANSDDVKDLEIVPAQVQVHKGPYRDERQQPEEFLGPRSESTLIYCVVFVESVTENSFTFDMREVIYCTQEVTELISDGTAYFIEDGKKAIYQGGDTTLYFWFGDDQIDPIIGCMTITGMEKLENIRYLNTDIPGHEAN